MEKIFIHIDMDAFFASVEQHDHPEWKGKPVIVGGLPDEKRGVVSTASYEARVYGVHSAMPVTQAYKLCPDGIFTHGNYKRYIEVSDSIMKILENYSPDIEQRSIDEACVDLTGTEQLFGPVEETAIKIKNEIFEKTGLTVSIGMGPTRYLAKLASEVNKPDGFYRINAGQEKAFMLSLPLKKVWGIGDKTVSKLNSFGIFTTEQIYEKSLDILKKKFGKSGGEFLYNVVRGLETLEPKKATSRSISAENTFPYDLNDLYVEETQLMELCQTVMFRLLKERSQGKTAFIKIRYEDFTTVSAQETTGDYVTSVDDFYQRIKKIYEEKRIGEKGIRLLGVGISNLEYSDQVQEQVLFDFGEGKKQAVENAILKLQQKNSSLKITKARLLNNKIKSILLAVFLAIPAIYGNRLTAEEIKELKAAGFTEIPKSETKIESEASGGLNSVTGFDKNPFDNFTNLFSTPAGNKDVFDLYSRGYWEGTVEGSENISYSKKNGINYSTPDFIFKQEVDLDLFLTINKSFYFQTSFADQFAKNTIAAGYKGNKYLKEVKIANRGIDFPAYYSASAFNLNFTGGLNQAPGLKIHWEDYLKNKWKADFAIKYNLVTQKDAVFYGKNSVTQNFIELNEYLTGQFFAFPSEKFLENISAIYVQDLSSEGGSKYKKISESQYLSFASRKLLVLSKDASASKRNGTLPVILVEYKTPLDFNGEAGSYENENTFLGKIQKLFNQSGKKYKLSDFAYDFNATYEGKKVLKIQNTTGFSPFVCAQKYDLGNISKADVKILFRHSEQINKDYEVSTDNEDLNFISQDFINKNHLFAEIFNSEITNENDFSIPEKRFPLAAVSPESYLNLKTQTDLVLCSRVYRAVTRFDIGTEAEGSSVKVYKNGVQLSQIQYDQDSGEVKINTSISDYDKIYITWNEDSSSLENGSLSAAMGFLYNFNQKFKGDVAFTTDWAVSPSTKFAEEEKSKSGYFALSGGLDYSSKNIEFSNKSAVSLKNNNTTGKYKLVDFETTANSTNYLGKNSAYSLTNSFAPVITLEDSTKIQLNTQDNGTSDVKTSKDSEISGYKSTMQWNFESDASEKWAAMSVSLPQGSKILNSTEFQLALKNENISCKDYDLYLQLGIKASSEKFYEDFENIPAWKITDSLQKNIISAFDPAKNGWQIVKISVSDKMRSKITSNTDFRLIVHTKNSSALNNMGELSAGPYEIAVKQILIDSTKVQGLTNISASTIKDNSVPEQSSYNDNDNFAEKIHFEISDSSIKEETGLITFSRYFKPSDIFEYENLIFYTKFENVITETSLESCEFPMVISLLKDKSKNSDDDEAALKLKISKDEMKKILADEGIWHQVKINLVEKKAWIDSFELKTSGKLTVNSNKIPSQLKIELNALQENKYISKADFYIDQIVLENSSPWFHLNNIAALRISRDETIVQAGNIPLIKNPFLNLKTKENAALSTRDQNKQNGTISVYSEGKIQLLTVDFEANADFSTEAKNGLSSASHKIQTSRAIFNILGFSESFLYNKDENHMEKGNSLSLDFSKFKIPLNLDIKAEMNQSTWNNNQKISGKLGSQFNISKTTVSLTAEARANQKNENKTSQDEENPEYFKAWTESYKKAFSKGNDDASKREIENLAQLKVKLPVINLEPSIDFSTSSSYTNTNSVYFKDSTVTGFKIPFVINQNKFTFNWNKTGGQNNYIEKGGSYLKDYEILFENLSNRSWYFEAMPFADLFQDSIKNKLEPSESKTESSFYTSLYDFSWQRKIYSDLKDFFIPSMIKFSVSRDIRFASDNTDLYQIKLNLLNTAFNIFGKYSTTKICSWYETDEFSTSLTSSLRIPKEDFSSTVYTISFYNQSSLFITDKNYLKAGLDFQIETDNSWNAGGTIIYSRRVNNGLITPLIMYFSSNLQSNQILATRSDSLDVKLQYNGSQSELNQIYEYNHKLETKIKQNITINTGICLQGTYSPKDVFTLQIKATAGAKLSF